MNVDENVKKLAVSFEESANFGDTFNLFLDLSENQEFRNIGVAKQNNQIKMTIALLTKKVFKGASLNNYKSMYADKYKLWHGAFFVKGMLSMFFYFEESRKGMVAISKGKGNMQFARFSLYEADKDSFISNKSSDYTN